MFCKNIFLLKCRVLQSFNSNSGCFDRFVVVQSSMTQKNHRHNLESHFLVIQSSQNRVVNDWEPHGTTEGSRTLDGKNLDSSSHNHPKGGTLGRESSPKMISIQALLTRKLPTCVYIPYTCFYSYIYIYKIPGSPRPNQEWSFR